LPAKRQNILYSATMTVYVDVLISDFLVNPIRKTISISGTPLTNISQEAYAVRNFYTKVNLLNTLLEDRETYRKVLVFVNTKADAELLYELTEFDGETSMIHGSKEVNYRTNAIADFESGESRILIATDVIARGIDLDLVSHVISFDTPFYPENYIHRIGRTGRAEANGKAILFYTEKEEPLKEAIESLMNYKISVAEFPEYVTVSSQLTDEEKGKPPVHKELSDTKPVPETGAAFHEKSAKNSKVKKERVSYEMQIKERFGKPLRRGDKTQNMKKKSRKR
ncbi:MAG: DEAD/DEAH box helicase, partial [Spirosomaceae bacterium]|nr:DEAD/DEAH box helicase [Spirosomataceae bacterium]